MLYPNEMNSMISHADILGTAEVAEVLGVSKQRIHSLRKMADFPEPFLKLASTPLWDRGEIMKFLSHWQPWKVINVDG
jgi:predicted DNA-binding transcriptional regulator AlpA